MSERALRQVEVLDSFGREGGWIRVSLPREPWRSDTCSPLAPRPETAPRITPRPLPPPAPLTGAARVSWFKRLLREALPEDLE